MMTHSSEWLKKGTGKDSISEYDNAMTHKEPLENRPLKYYGPPVPPTHVKPTHFASASEGNQVSGSVPATQPSQCTSTVQSTEVGEGCPTYYSDDPALSHFDQESSDGDSDHDFQPNMEQDSGPDSVNKDHHNHATSDRTPFHMPGLTSFSFASSEQEVRQKQQCGKCGESGHNRLRCKNLVLPENSSPRPPVTPGEPRQRKCRTCGVAGHNRQRCPNWEPPTSNENQKDC
ncbi:hypothetical protein QYF36_026263 [Acer negundo]|nr:hypothetical protein QYF36_026263 [Acer negundo]